LSAAAAEVLSDAPESVLSTGNNIIYVRLYNAGVSNSTQHSKAIFWQVPTWRVQIQPYQLLLLVSNLEELDLFLFANLLDKYSKNDADAIANSFNHQDDKVRADLLPDTSIVGCNIRHFTNCLKNFGFTIDVLFQLKSSVSIALFSAIQRTGEFAERVIFGPTDCLNQEIFQYVARLFAKDVHEGFSLVIDESFSTSLHLVNYLADVPRVGDTNSQVAFDIASIRSRHRRVTTPPAVSTPTKVRSTGRKQKKTSTPAPPPPIDHAPTVDVAPSSVRLCGYFHSSFGCKKLASECPMAHRNPATAEETEQLDRFFRRFGKLVRRS
jgi:hypothetical protein